MVLYFFQPPFSVIRACVSLPKNSFLRISSLNKIFMTTANVTFPYGDEFPKDTTKVLQLFGNELSSKHARVSSSSERPATDNCMMIPLKSFKCSAIDWPSLSFVFISSRIKKIFVCAFFVSYVFSKFFQYIYYLMKYLSVI